MQIFDLIVVGNGLAAQTFLFELFAKLDVNKSQNFSVAQIFSEEITASCSLRSTATVSLSGIEKGVSELGDELHQSYYLFEQFFKKHSPLGVEKVKQIITFSKKEEKEKLQRRYKTLEEIRDPLFKEEKFWGTRLDSYIVSPKIFNSWFHKKLARPNLVVKKNFVKKMFLDEQDLINCELASGEVVRGYKIVLCTGAYAKIFSAFFEGTEGIQSTQTVAGSFLERSIHLGMPSFYLTIDGYNLIYRSAEEKLLLGSASNANTLLIADYMKLQEILFLFKEKCRFDIGELNDFKIVTGLRHKAAKRRASALSLNPQKTIFMINGLYKNGFTFSHLCAEKILKNLNL